MGADITYKCIDTLKFEITVKFYRDCRGVGFSNPSSQTSVRCATGGQVSVNLTLDNIKEITPVCATATGQCIPANTYGTGEGIEQHTYKATIDFNTSPFSSLKNCCRIIIQTGQCCRNGAINTGPSGNFYTYAEVDLCKAPCNTSPGLTTEPIGILCCNQPFFFNNGASDTADFDSLSYAWANPLSGWSQNIGYSGGFYAYNHPFQVYYPGSLTPPYANPNASPPIGLYLDPLTGDIILTPTRCDEVTVAVIEVTEWRKDTTGTYQKIGVTRRDMQFITKTCPDNNPPEIDGPYSYSVCAGSQICFNITTDDPVFTPPPPATPPPPDTVTISWNRGIPGATFTVINPTARLQTGRFCWTPGLDKASDLPYTFTVTARDNACPLNAVTVRAFRVRVKHRAEAIRHRDTLPCGVYAVESEPISGFRGNPTYRWQILDSNLNIVFNKKIAKFWSTNGFLSVKQKDTLEFRRGGKYIIQHTINNSPQNCPTTYYDTLVVPDLLEANLSIGPDTFICAGTTLDLVPYIYNGTPPITYRWSTMGVDTNGNVMNNVATYPGDTLNHYELFLPTNQYDTAISVIIQDASGCTSTDTILVFQKENPVAYLPADPRICTYDSIKIVPTFDTAYWVNPLGDTLKQGDTLFKEWFYNGSPLSYSTDDSVTIHRRGEHILRVSDSLGCWDEDTLYLYVNDTVIADAGPDQILCFNDTLLLAAGGLDTVGNGKSGTYIWYDLTKNDPIRTNVGTNDTLIFSATDDTWYELELYVTEGGVQCFDNDSVFIDVNPLPVIGLKPDFEQCDGSGDISLRLNGLLSSDPVGGNWAVVALNGAQVSKPNWITGETFHADSAGGKPTQQRVTLEYTYQDPLTQCINSNTIVITVNPLPEIILEEGDFCQDIVEFNLADEIVTRPGNVFNGTQSWKCLECNGNDFSQMLVDKGVGIPDYYLKIDENTYDIQNPNIDTITLEYTFRNAFGCLNRDTVDIRVWRVPKLDFRKFGELCFNDGDTSLNDLFDVNFTNGWWSMRQGASYRDSNQLGGITDSMWINTLNSVELANENVTPYSFGLRYNHNATGCYAFLDTILTINPQPNISIAPFIDEFCDVDDPELLSATPGGATGSWSSSVSGVLTGNSFDPSKVLPQDKGNPIWLKYYYYSPNTGCASEDSISTVVTPSPIVTLPPDDEFCKPLGQSSVALNVPVTQEFASGMSWTLFNFALSNPFVAGGGSDAITNNVTINNDTINHIYIEVTTDPSGACDAAFASTNIFVHPIPDVSVLPNVPNGCNPVTTDFEITVNNKVDPATASYAWDLGNGDSSWIADPSATYDVDGTNDVVLRFRSAFGCDTTVRTSVDVYPLPIADFLPDPNNFTTAALPRFIFTDKSEVPNVLGATVSKWSWDFDSPDANPVTSTEQNPTVYYSADTATYNVTLVVETNHGCTATYTSPVVIGPDLIVYIPNAFTPNGFGPSDNDEFKAHISGEKTMELLIFNRWGEIMFRTTDKTIEWDGTYNGADCQQDVYAYQLKVTALNDEVYTYTGTITLIR